MKNLINEVTRIKEMMGVNLLTENPLMKFIEKSLLGSTEALVKSGEKTFSKEIEQAYDKALADVIADAASPYAKKLESAGVKTIEDLANLEGKGFTKEEVQAFTQDLLKRAAKVVDQFAPEAAQDLIDKTFKESSSYVNTMKRVDRAMSSFMDGVPSEKVEGVKKHISALEASKLSIINSKALSQTEKEIAARRIDEAIASLESKLAQGVENAAAAALKVSEEQAQKLTDELAKAFGGVDDLFKVPVDVLKSMMEKQGWPKEEVNKGLMLFAKEAPKTQEEFLQKAVAYIENNKLRILQELNQEKQLKSIKEATKLSPAELLSKFGKSYSKFYNSSKVGKYTIWALWLGAIGLTGGLTGWYKKIKPVAQFIYNGGDLPEELNPIGGDGNAPVNAPVTGTAVASKTTFDTYMSGASKIFSDNKSKYTWDVDPSDNTIIIVHTPAAGDVKYKVNSDGTTYTKQ